MKIEYLYNSIGFILSYLKSGLAGVIFRFLQIATLKVSIAEGGQAQLIANRCWQNNLFVRCRVGAADIGCKIHGRPAYTHRLCWYFE